MPRIRIVVAADRASAEAKVAAGPPATPMDLRTALAEAGVVHGLDPAAIDALHDRLGDATYQGQVCIARGTPAEPGADGRLEGACLGALQPGQSHADGHIDWHERHRLHPAHRGDLLVRIVPPTAGVPGTDVLGKPVLPKPGKPQPRRFGPGIQVDGEQALATRDGVVLATDRQLDVVALHVHQGQVDLATGNLHTAGSLQIGGDVNPGLAATADGDLWVQGGVLDANVRAGGSLQVQQGALGEHCELHAGQDLACRHATSARLRAGGTVAIGDQATHCRITANAIEVRRGRGTAFGGELRADQRIELLQAGTAQGAPLLLSVGDLLDEFAALAPQAAEAARLDRATLRGQRGDDGRLGGAKGLRSASRVTDRLQQERLRLLARQRELLKTATIRVAGTLHAGVELQFGEVRRRIEVPIQGAEFVFDLEHTTIVQRNLK